VGQRDAREHGAVLQVHYERVDFGLRLGVQQARGQELVVGIGLQVNLEPLELVELQRQRTTVRKGLYLDQAVRRVEVNQMPAQRIAVPPLGGAGEFAFADAEAVFVVPIGNGKIPWSHC